MSYPPPPPVPAKNSKGCCIGCLIVLFVTIVIFGAVIYFGLNFLKKEFELSFLQVSQKNDPELSATPESLFPENVGEFKRTDISTGTLQLLPTTIEFIREMSEPSSNTLSAKYKASNGSDLVIGAVPTKDYQNQSRSKPQSSFEKYSEFGMNEGGLAFKVPGTNSSYSDRILIWSKQNWTFNVHTTDSINMKFFEAYNPPK